MPPQGKGATLSVVTALRGNQQVNVAFTTFYLTLFFICAKLHHQTTFVSDLHLRKQDDPTS
jgi:hypothetical protein